MPNQNNKLKETEVTCPQCKGDGYYVGTTSGHGCDGTQESCNINCPVPIPVQEQCDMCGATGKISEEFETTLKEISFTPPPLEDPNEIPF